MSIDIQGLRLSPLGRLIEPAVLAQVEQDLRSAGTVINHLNQRLGSRTTDVWRQMAEASGRRFIATPAEAGPIDTRLLSQVDALEYLVLPRVRSFTTIHLMTPDPFAKLSDFTPLRNQLGRFVPGGQANIKLDITTPACFRELFGLIYPDAAVSYRDTADAAVLAALLPRRSWAEHRPTPEEEAQARAAFLGLPFFDPLLEPPARNLLGEQPDTIYTSRRLIPYSRDEGGHLTILSALTSDKKEEYDTLQEKVRNLSVALNQPLRLALTSPRRLLKLLKEF